MKTNQEELRAEVVEKKEELVEVEEKEEEEKGGMIVTLSPEIKNAMLDNNYTQEEIMKIIQNITTNELKGTPDKLVDLESLEVSVRVDTDEVDRLSAIKEEKEIDFARKYSKIKEVTADKIDIPLPVLLAKYKDTTFAGAYDIEEAINQAILSSGTGVSMDRTMTSEIRRIEKSLIDMQNRKDGIASNRLLISNRNDLDKIVSEFDAYQKETKAILDLTTELIARAKVIDKLVDDLKFSTIDSIGLFLEIKLNYGKGKKSSIVNKVVTLTKNAIEDILYKEDIEAHEVQEITVY